MYIIYRTKTTFRAGDSSVEGTLTGDDCWIGGFEVPGSQFEAIFFVNTAKFCL